MAPEYQQSINQLIMSAISRRELLANVGLAGLAVVVNPKAGAEEATHSEHESQKSDRAKTSEQVETNYQFFNREEAEFIEAAVARLIPTDEDAGAIEAGVPNYLDKQLGGAWGAGERLYMSGPWEPTRPGLGYQLPLKPGELFHTAIKAINTELNKSGQAFWEMSPDQQDEYLHKLEADGVDLNGIPSGIFFSQLLEMTIEGFFSDPVYGGNKDMVAWKMIGFPGAYATYYDLIDKHGIKFRREPVSLGQSGGSFMPDPNIPAESPHQ
jgi:gluconate 2-dehydrogenase gamma chain